MKYNDQTTKINFWHTDENISILTNLTIRLSRGSDNYHNLKIVMIINNTSYEKMCEFYQGQSVRILLILLELVIYLQKWRK